jgi:Tol biopolymer transport system component
VWEVNLSTGVLQRMTSDPATDSDATWAPDGTRVAFTSTRSGTMAVYVKDVASGREEPVAPMAGMSLVVDGWTPDGRALVVRRPGGRDTYLVTLDADRTLRPLVANAFTVDEIQVSPNARWAAYNSDESGAWEVYVTRFPTFTSRRRVSTAGGVQPKWRRDGKELFYLALDSSMMSVPIDTGAELRVQRPVKLFDSGITPNPGLTQYGVTPDGQRFLGLDRSWREGETLTVLLNWLTPENLGRR